MNNSQKRLQNSNRNVKFNQITSSGQTSFCRMPEKPAPPIYLLYYLHFREQSRQFAYRLAA
jgi:hypothetical protein